MAHYPVWEWILPADPAHNRSSWGKLSEWTSEWKLPFLDGVVRIGKQTTNFRTITKAVLNAYAEGRVQ